ncbi:tRNA lysidine(34) synthetase TilS [Paenibacillus sp. TRM 82003]|nr:tRNA lysidine(34) synthetase TilS [Paenibacillus sp. TRM 82003]
MSGYEVKRRVAREIEERSLLRPDERIVVGVSGGPDSVALLHLLRELGGVYRWRLSAAHVNHGLRGDESDEEEAYVRGLCDDLGVPCYAARVDVESALPRYGNNVQAAARALRYQAFREAAAAWDTNTVALGHHGDDQAETVLMRLLRGTGPGGLAGIRAISLAEDLKLVRPLLRITKAELETYCESFGLEPRRDSSNDSRKYFRNVVRLDLLPYIRKLREGVDESLRRIAELSADEDEYLDGVAMSMLEGKMQLTESGVRLARDVIAGAPVALQRRMIKIILNSLKTAEASIDFPGIERIREAVTAAAPTTTELRLGENAAFRRSYDTLEWTAADAPKTRPYLHTVDVTRDGRLRLPELGATIEWRLTDPLGEPWTDPYVVRFDADAVGGRWIVRTREAGDRMEPFGLNGSKKVKDMFIDGKLPKRQRAAWPIVAGEDEAILWVPGFRRSKHAPIGARTKRVIEVRLRFEGNIYP